MARFYNNFTFVGTIALPKETDKFKPYRELDNKKGWLGKSLKLSVKGDGNYHTLEMMEGYMADGSSKVFGFTKPTTVDGVKKDGEKIEIAWKDRLDPKNIEKVADFAKVIIDLDNPSKRWDMVKKLQMLETGDSLTEEQLAEMKDRHGYIDGDMIEFLKEELEKSKKKKREFLTTFDAIEFLNKAVAQFGDRQFFIKGNVVYSEYEGKYFEKFEPSHIYLAEKGEKNRFKGELEIYFNKESLDESLFKENKKYYVNGWVKNYDSKLKKDVFIPKQIVIDGSKVNYEEEKQVKRLEAMKNVFAVKGKKYHSAKIEASFVNGSERVEFTIDMLDDFEKEQIELGFQSFEDIKKAKNKKGKGSYGEKVTETKMVTRLELAVETELTADDFVLVVAKDETFEEVKDKKESKVDDEDKAPFDIDDDDLFG